METKSPALLDNIRKRITFMQGHIYPRWKTWKPSVQETNDWDVLLAGKEKELAEKAVQRMKQQTKILVAPVMGEFTGHYNNLMQERRDVEPPKPPAKFLYGYLVVVSCAELQGPSGKNRGVYIGRRFTVGFAPYWRYLKAEADLTVHVECSIDWGKIQKELDKYADQIRLGFGEYIPETNTRHRLDIKFESFLGLENLPKAVKLSRELREDNEGDANETEK